MADWYRRIDGSNIYSGNKFVNEDFLFNKVVKQFNRADYVLLIRIKGKLLFSYRHNMIGQDEAYIENWISTELKNGTFGGYSSLSSAIIQVSWDNYYTEKEVSLRLKDIFKEAGFLV